LKVLKSLLVYVPEMLMYVVSNELGGGVWVAVSKAGCVL